MSDMRDTLMGIIAREVMDAEATADAIIAAMPDMVRPLVWHDYGTSDYPLSLGSVAEQNGAFCRISRISPDTWQIEGDLTGEYGSMESAKADAQAHHTAAILSAFGVQGGEA